APKLPPPTAHLRPKHEKRSPMSPEPSNGPGSRAPGARDLLCRTSLNLPVARVKEKARAGPASTTQTAKAELTVVAPGAAHYLTVKGELHERLLDEINARNLLGSGEEALGEVVREFVARALREDDLALNDAERRQLAED